jgi:hypothetical protein
MTESHVSWMTVLHCCIMWFHKSRGTKNTIHASYYMYRVSHEGKFCTKFLNQYSFICSKFYKLYKYNINISHNKATGLRNSFNNLNVNNMYTYFHWLFNPECQHIFGKQTGYIFQFPKTIKIWTTKHYASLNQWYNTE